MSTQLTTQEIFKERIVNNLRNQFMDLMPDEMITDLTNAAYDEFINGAPNKRIQRDYNPFNDPNTLKGMLMTELKEMSKEKIKAILAEPQWQSLWDNNNNEYVIEAMNEIIVNNAGLFVQQMFKGIIGSAATNVLNNLRNGY